MFLLLAREGNAYNLYRVYIAIKKKKERKAFCMFGTQFNTAVF